MKRAIDVMTQVEEGALLPVYSSKSAAGADVAAFIEQDIIIEPGSIQLIPTGLRFTIPEGFEIQVRPRSGLALKNQVTVLNAPGTIDADYRGELKVILINHGKIPFVVKKGMRVAQIILAEAPQAHFFEGECLITTERGEGGFGHTGTH